MRDAIARALSWVLSVVAPHRPGRHSAGHFLAREAEHEATPVGIWQTPWACPVSSREARAIFMDEKAQSLGPLQRERYYALGFAALGVDYDFPTLNLTSVIAGKQAAA